MVKQKKKHTLQPSVRPHILRVVDLKPSGVAVLQGSDGTTIDHQVTQLAHCSVPIADTNLYPHKYVRTNAVHCQICGSRKKAALMLLCNVCNKGFHTYCLDPPLAEVPDFRWQCETHQVTSWNSGMWCRLHGQHLEHGIYRGVLFDVQNWRVLNACEVHQLVNSCVEDMLNLLECAGKRGAAEVDRVKHPGKSIFHHMVGEYMYLETCA